MRALLVKVALALLLVAPAAGPAGAAEPMLLGTYRDWNAFKLDEPTGPACWMVSRPKKQEGEFTKRGDVFILVTHRPAERAFDTVNFIAGYPIAEGSEVTLDIGQKKFRLFVDGEGAWARNAEIDSAIAEAMRAGTIMVVRGTSSRGTRTTDTFSLSGATAAHQAIGAACGVTGK